MYLQLLALIWKYIFIIYNSPSAHSIAGMSCCKSDINIESGLQLNQDEVFYFDFVINELP